MAPRFSTLRAVLFDLDGTLVRTFIDFPAIKAQVQAISVRFGVGDVTSSVNDPLEIVKQMAGALPPNLGEKARREAFTAIEALEEAGCALPEEIPGALQLLRHCRDQQIAIGIVTRNTRRIALRLLDQMSLPFDVLVAREDSETFKPHPAPVIEACRRLGVDPRDAMMVGDLWTDVAAARAANVAIAVGIQWKYDPPGRFSACVPDIQIDSLNDLLPLLLA